MDELYIPKDCEVYFNLSSQPNRAVIIRLVGTKLIKLELEHNDLSDLLFMVSNACKMTPDELEWLAKTLEEEL